MKYLKLFLTVMLLNSCISVFSQIPNPTLPSDLLNKPWSGKWIAVAGEPSNEYGVYTFRKKIVEVFS